MNPRTTLILLGIALALGAYVWFGEVRGKQRRAEAERAARELVETPRDAWTSLELPLEGGGTARLEAGEDGWTLAAPLRFATDEAAVERVLDALEGLAFESEIERVPDDPEPFGLGGGAGRAELRAGEESLVLALGGRAPVGSGRYLRLSNRPGRIFTVPGATLAALEPSLPELRDKRVVRADPEAVRRLGLRFRDGPEIRAERTEDGWTLAAPLADRADGRRIERLLEDLRFARAGGFVDAPGPLSEYGLEPPEVEVELGLDEGSEKLVLGRADGSAYARADGRTVVWELAERVVSSLPREIFAYRHKRVLEFDEGEVRRLELAFPRAGVEYGFERGDDGWAPEDESLNVDPFALSDLAYALGALDASGIEPEPAEPERLGLAPARVRATAYAGGGEPLGWLELGDPDPERGLPARGSGGGRVWRVPGELGEDVPLGLDAFRERFAAEPDGDDADAGEAPPDEDEDEHGDAAGGTPPDEGGAAPPGGPA